MASDISLSSRMIVYAKKFSYAPLKAEVKKTSKSHISYRMTGLTALALPSVGDFLCLTRHCARELREMICL